MKKNLLTGLLILSFLSIIPFACRKTISDPLVDPPMVDTFSGVRPHTLQQPVQTVTPPFPETGVTGCSYAPDYGDTLLYPQPTGSDYIISPINNPGPGRYFSWPDGMVIDSITGSINITKSETGEKYMIGFVKAGTTDTCLQTLIIAGASYMDSIYVLSDNETTAIPYYNADPNLVSVCGTGNGSPNGPPCQWDITNSAKNQKVVVDNNTGVIDLQKTLNGTGLLGGAFGLLPLNGQTVTTTIYYKLSDPSNNALQHIQVELMFFNQKSQMTSGLLNNVLLKLNNILTGNLISKSGNPRPPFIIITRYN